MGGDERVGMEGWGLAGFRYCQPLAEQRAILFQQRWVYSKHSGISFHCKHPGGPETSAGGRGGECSLWRKGGGWGELFGTEVTAGKQVQHERLPPGHRRGPCGMGQRPPSRLPDCSSESGFLHTCSQSRWYILDSIAVKWFGQNLMDFVK